MNVVSFKTNISANYTYFNQINFCHKISKKREPWNWNFCRWFPPFRPKCICSDKRREIWNFLLTVLLTLPLKSSTRKLWNFISLFYIFFLFFFCFSNSSSDCKAKFFWVQFTWLLSCSDLNICGGDSSKAAKRWRKMNLIGFGIAGTNHSSRLCDFYLWILSGRGCGTFLP